MDRIENHTSKTDVKFLISTVAALTVCFVGSLGSAQNTTPGFSINTPINCYAPGMSAEDKASCKADQEQARRDAKGDKEGDREQNKCDSLRKDALEANGKLQQACADGGFTDKCVETAIACEVIAREMPSDSGDNVNDLVNIALKQMNLSTAAGIGNKSVARGKDPGDPLNDDGTDCANMTSEDYRTQRKDLEEKMKDLKKEQTDLLKDLKKNSKDAKKEIADIQDDITKEKEQLEKSKDSLDDDMRKQVTDFMNTQNEIKKQLRSKTLEVLKYRSQLVASQRKLTADLIKLNADAMASSCAADAQNAYADFVKRANMGSMSASLRKAKKKEAYDRYATCMKSLESQRQGIMEAAQAEQQGLTTAINQVGAESGDLQTSVETAQNQLTQIQTQNKNAKAKMDQNLLTKMQTATSKMQAISTNAAEEEQIANNRQAEINKDLNEAQNKIAQLGRRPPAGAKVAPASVKATIRTSATTISGYTTKCCSNTPDDSLCRKANDYAKIADPEGHPDKKPKAQAANKPVAPAPTSPAPAAATPAAAPAAGGQ